MYRIGLVCIDAKNLGDIVIRDNVEYLMRQIMKEGNISNYEFYFIEMGKKAEKKETLSLKYKRRKYWKKANEENDSNIQKEKAIMELWHLSDEYLYFEKQEKPIIKTLDLVVFVGGGIIKYKHQKFHFYLHEITRIANEKGIPVIINAAGVEGYEENSVECQLLKRAINEPCVKYISTRDDLNTLKTCFVYNPTIVVEQGCDPALWSKECYGVQKKENSRKVGLNVIRPAIFGEYRGYVNKDILKDMYFALIKRLKANGYTVELFTNGYKADIRFVSELFEAYPALNQDYNICVTVPKTQMDLVNTIASYERFLGVRLHASIIGSALNIPNVNLVWNNKQIMFGEQMGTEENYITREHFDDAYIYEKLMNAKEPEANVQLKRQSYESLKYQVLKNIQM